MRCYVESPRYRSWERVLANENVTFYFLCGRSVRGCAIFFFIEFCFNYYTVIYICILHFFLFKHKLHFCYFIFYNDFIRFHRISLRTM